MEMIILPRPTTKPELIEAANSEYDKLFSIINNMSDEEQNQAFLFEDRDKNIRDVLIHLYEWHQLLLNFTKSNQNNIAAPFLLEPYNWRTYPQMNIDFFEKHQKTPYEQSKKMLEQSHKDIMKDIEGFSNEELFSKKYFDWVGSTSLGSYFVSATSSHYNWAIKKIKKQIKLLKVKD